MDALGPILQIVLLCVAAYFLWFAPQVVTAALSGFTWLPAAISTATFSAATWGYLALGAAVLIDPEGFGEIAGGVAETVGEVAGSVIAGAAGGVATGLFGTSWTTIFFGAIGAYLLYGYLTRDKSDEQSNEKGGQDGKQPSNAAPA